MFNRICSLFASKVGRLGRQQDYEGLANLLGDPSVADKAAEILVHAGEDAVSPVLKSARRAFNALERSVMTASHQTHAKVKVVRAYVVVLGRLGNAQSIPVVLEALVYSACVAMVPIEAEEDEEDDVDFQLQKGLFLNYRACRSLLETAADVLTSFGDPATDKLISLLADARPPVVYAARCILERIGTPRAVKAAAEARVQDDPTLKWSIRDVIGER